MGAALKRDELRDALNDAINAEGADAIEEAHERLKPVIAWLERLPEGCELVGFRPDGQVVYDFGVVRGSPFEKHVWVEHPDDLTNAGKSRQFEAYECKKCNLDGPDNCWNHKVGKR